MNIGIVGPGSWGSRIAEVFRSQGAKVAYHVRRGKEPVEGMGELVSLADLLMEANSGLVDAVVCAAPPEVTLAAYETFKTLGIPSLLTKPLQLQELGEHPPLVPTVVDYVRLWSPHYHRIKQDLRGRQISKVSVEFFDHGPFRGYPGLWDYGPHAAAFVLDLLGDYEMDVRQVWKTERDGGDYRYVEGTIGLVPFEMAVGNASEEASSRRLSVETKDGRRYFYEEDGRRVTSVVGDDARVDEDHQALQLMVADFMEDVRKKYVNLYSLWLSTKICKLLTMVEAHA